MIKNTLFKIIKEDFFDKELIKELRKKGDIYLIIYLKLLLFSYENEGFVFYEGTEKDIYEQLYFEIDEDMQLIKETIKILEKNDMVLLLEKDIKFLYFDYSRNRNSKEYKQWRKAVFERDGYICQHCGVKGGVLNAHHIIRWCDDINKRFDVDNGITLCEGCHKKQHKRSGKCE